MCHLHPEVKEANLARWVHEAIQQHCCSDGSAPRLWAVTADLVRVAMAGVFRSAAPALSPHQRVLPEHLYSSWVVHVLPCSVWRIMYQQHEGELWPQVTSAGVEEIPSMSPAGTVSRLWPLWAAFSEWSLPWAGHHIWCPAEIAPSLHYSVGLCRDSMITGYHRQEFSVSRWNFRMKHEFSAGQNYEVLVFPQYEIITAHISYCKHHLHCPALKMEKIRHFCLWLYLICPCSSLA